MKSEFFQFIVWYLTSSCKMPDDADLHARNVKFLDLNINKQAETCNDFKSYACGNSFNNVPFEKIPPEGINWTRVRSEQTDQRLLNMLKEENPNSNVIKKATDVFQSCTQEKNTKASTFDAAKVELNRLGFDTKELSSSSEPSSNFNHMSALAQLLKISTIYNDFFMMRIEAIEDPQNPGQYVPLIITNPPNQSTIDDDYAKTVYAMLSIEHNKKIENASTFIKNMQTITNKAKTLPMTKWSRKSLGALKMKTNDLFFGGNNGAQCLWKFEWEKFFEELFGNLWDNSNIVETEFFVYVTHFNVLMEAVRLLQCTEKDTLARALWLNAFRFASPVGSQRLQSVYKEEVKEPLGVLELSKEMQCLAIVKDLFRPLVAHTLIKNLTDEDKNELNEIQKLIKEEFSLLIQNAEWLSDTAKEYLVPKIENMKINVPYIDTPKDADKLIDDYQNITVNRDCFYQMYADMMVEKSNKLFERIFDARDKPRLAYQPSMSLFPNQQTEIEYYPLLNEIEIPVFMIGYPNYYGHQFRALNVGGLGFQLARKMAYALNSANVQLNEYGKIEYQRWQNKDKTNYADRVNAMKEVFSQEESKLIESNEDQKNEMLIDSIGLTVAFRTIEKIYPNLDETHAEQSSDGDTIEKHTKRKLFYLAAAITTCRVMKNMGLDYYVDSPNRLNGVFRRSKEFVKTWNCDDSN